MPYEAIGYWRKSVGRRGIPAQRRTTTLFVENDGGRIVDERDDRDRTAYRAVGGEKPPREGFDEVLAILRERPGLRLAAWHVDRITRDLDDVRAILETRCVIVTVRSGTYDLSTSNGRKRLVGDVNDAWGEVDHNIERILERKDEHAAEGRWLGGAVPFGWRRVPREDPDDPSLLEIQEAEAALLRAAKDDALAGRPMGAVAAEWNAAGYRTRYGSPWNRITVRRALMRPRNAGLMVHRGKVVGRAQWPPLWDEAAHEALCAMFSDPARRTTPGPERANLLSGLALCGTCGSRVTVRKGEDARYYACVSRSSHPARRQDLTDEFVTEIVMRRLEAPDAARLLRADTRAEREELLRRRGTVKGVMARRMEMLDDGLITDAEFTRSRRRHRDELEEIRQRLEVLNRGDVLAPLAGAPREAWPGLGIAGQRAVVAAVVHVTLFPGRHGRPAGWRPGDPYFDYETVDVRWVRR